MDAFLFENIDFPVYCRNENIAGRTLHSEISHWHNDLQLIIVNKGTILCKLGGKEVKLHSGDVCFINRKQLHLVQAIDEPENHMVLIVGTQLLMENTFIYEKFFRPMLEDAQFCHIYFAGNDSHAARIKKEITEIEKQMQKKPFGYELDVLASLFRLGKHLYLAYCEKGTAGLMDNKALTQQKMVEFIYEHYPERLSLAAIARAGSISERQAYKLFKQYTNLSPIAYLNRYRLEMSLNLLRSTSDPVSAIAQTCGFSDQSYFNRLFMREYGVTPLVYRTAAIKAQKTVSFSSDPMPL